MGYKCDGEKYVYKNLYLVWNRALINLITQTETETEAKEKKGKNI